PHRLRGCHRSADVLSRTKAPPSSDPSRAADEAADRSSSAAAGTQSLGPAGAAALLELAARERRTGGLSFSGPWGSSAQLTLRAGRVTDASAGRLRGPEAVWRIFLRSEARYAWLPAEAPLGPGASPTIRAEVRSLIVEGLRQ